MAFDLNIDTYNDAFQGEARFDEVARILAELSVKLAKPGLSEERGVLHDTNGNCVGAWRFTDD